MIAVAGLSFVGMFIAAFALCAVFITLAVIVDEMTR